MKKTIVILSGKAGAGKDTFAAMLGGAWERISFADEVKITASELVGLPLNYFHDVNLKDSVLYVDGDFQTPRDVLIKVGMEHRELDPNYWTNKAIEKIRESDSEFFVITDWRFPNELEAMRQAFEEIHSVRIAGSNHLGSSHESECALDNFRFDSYIVNRSDLDALREKARLLRGKMGEDSIIGDIYSDIYPKALNLCRKHTRNASDLKDVTQESMLEVINSFKKKFDFSCNLWTFAYKVIYFTAQNYRRKRETYNRHFSLSDGNSVEYVGNNGTVDLSTPLLAKRINAALLTLSDFDRKLFKLRHDGWKHAEIGKELGIKENYSRRRLFSIHKKLREQLGDVYSELI